MAKNLQRGQMLIAILLMIGLGVAALVFAFANPAAIKIETDKKTAAALAQARDALIGYAAGLNYSSSERPGNLPCPASDVDGLIESSSCSSLPSRIGRLPWKKLGLPDLRDGYGERLWYAVSGTFKKNPQAGILNSDTAGDFTVAGTTSASNVIAIVFAPGPVVGAQNRDASLALCPLTSMTIPQSQCATNYLEGGNEDGDTIFTTGLPTNTFNDTLMVITSDVFFPAVTTRVAREARSFLNAYYADPSNGYFPNANAFTDGTYRCNPSVFQGRIPKDINAGGLGCSAQHDWGTVVPPWFFANNWQEVIFYAVSPLCTDTANAAQCISVGGLNVSGSSSNVRALVIASGRGLAGQVRPCVAAADCLEDAENTNGDDNFVTPVLSATDNDRLAIVSP